MSARLPPKGLRREAQGYTVPPVTVHGAGCNGKRCEAVPSPTRVIAEAIEYKRESMGLRGGVYPSRGPVGRNVVEDRMIDSLSVRLFLDTHPDQQAVKWMKVEERVFARQTETVKAPVVRE